MKNRNISASHVNIVICTAWSCFVYFFNFFHLKKISLYNVSVIIDYFSEPNPCLAKPCHKHAICKRSGLYGESHTCTCRTGYSGNGYNCVGEWFCLKFLKTFLLSLGLYDQPTLHQNFFKFISFKLSTFYIALITGIHRTTFDLWMLMRQ